MDSKDSLFNDFATLIKAAKLNCKAYYQKYKSTFEISDKFQKLPDDYLILKIGEKSNIFDKFIEFENERIINNDKD